ncbi:TPA: LOW QUALITY PROTEIN: hypothetical protein N0F65_008439 [Lagenidium giganteum]|uniref:RRM domain-containing protein n=1 Tax=Lagenidium giganteum TaxID=4803 RepID=A0AAV2YQG0_9STRA|nr:TPA: LOW QUALITY PROTEIN: hypothetical protein N0F65_008439 [Lagenidium giganteum]
MEKPNTHYCRDIHARHDTMEEERTRIELARIKNLAYIREYVHAYTRKRWMTDWWLTGSGGLDEQEADREAQAFLDSVRHDVLGGDAHDDATAAKKKKAPSAGPKNTSVYVTGLTTYIACKQLEGVCAQLGKVRRIKFYKDDRGGLKGDAVVTYASHAGMRKAIERLDNLEIKPGVRINAVEASFGAKKATVAGNNNPANSDHASESTPTPSSQPEPEVATRLFAGDVVLQEDSSKDDAADNKTATATPQLDLPSKSIILKHVWDPLEPQTNIHVFDELEEDMRSECSKFGAVDHVNIVANGSVVVRFHELDSAIKCLRVMQGRWFAGRQIVALFDPSTPEKPADTDTEVEAFLASIG